MSPRVRLALAVTLAVVAIVAVVVLPVQAWAQALLSWVKAAGPAGMVVFGVIYVAAAVFMLPASVLTLGAGFTWGPLVGTALVSPVSVTAATTAFLVGRFVARDQIAAKIGQDPRFAAIDAAVEREGLKLVILLRLSPVLPFNLLNYGLGLTRVRLRDFVLGSFLGMLPGTALYVYLGSLVTSAAALWSGERPDAGPLGLGLYWGGLVATIIVTVLITRIARRALSARLGPPTPPTTTSTSDLLVTGTTP